MKKLLNVLVVVGFLILFVIVWAFMFKEVGLFTGIRVLLGWR